MTGLEFTAAMVNSLAWSAAVAAAVVLLRRELAGTFARIRTVEFPGGKAAFATLVEYEKVVAAAADRVNPANDRAITQRADTAAGVFETLVAAAPRAAIMNAWGLLAYRLSVASGRVAPDRQHGRPQVARDLHTLRASLTSLSGAATGGGG